ncbi:MAG: hypothetical protein ACREX0_04475 [Noviherbaspirillum sp.]
MTRTQTVHKIVEMEKNNHYGALLRFRTILVSNPVSPSRAKSISKAHYLRQFCRFIAVQPFCFCSRWWHGICYYSGLSSGRSLMFVAFPARVEYSRLTTNSTKFRTTLLILGDSHGNDGRRGLEDGERQRSQIR